MTPKKHGSGWKLTDLPQSDGGMKMGVVRTKFLFLLPIVSIIATLPACGPKIKIKHQPVQFTEAP
jgi:hypothetical protein